MQASRNKFNFKRENLLQKRNIELFSKENGASILQYYKNLLTQAEQISFVSQKFKRKWVQPLLLYTILRTKRATKIDSISIYDKNIPVANLMATATSHRFTLML